MVVRLLPSERGAHGQQDLRRRHRRAGRRADRAQHADALGGRLPAGVLLGRDRAQPGGEHPGDHRQPDEGRRAVAGDPGRAGGVRAVAAVSPESQPEGGRVAGGRGARGGEARATSSSSSRPGARPATSRRTTRRRTWRTSAPAGSSRSRRSGASRGRGRTSTTAATRPWSRRCRAMWEYMQKAGTTEKLTDADIQDLVEFLKIL